MAKTTAQIPLRSFKLTWSVPANRVPRDVLPPEGEGGEVEWQIKLDGSSAPPILATFNARNYRRMVKAVDELKGNAFLMLQGYLTGGPDGLVLERAGFRVEERSQRGPPGRGGPPRRDRPGPGAGQPKIEVVRRLK